MNTELVEQAMRRREAAVARPIKPATPEAVVAQLMARALRLAVPVLPEWKALRRRKRCER